jgi:UDP-N-acetylglucosamine 2-epimerase (non-hydrolysing)
MPKVGRVNRQEHGLRAWAAASLQSPCNIGARWYCRNMAKVSIIFGTRPEAIKLCPVILKMAQSGTLSVHVCVTGQHRQMLDQVLGVFGVQPDVDLGLMQPNQTLADLTSRTITAVDAYLKDYRPGLVLVQGDTTTVVSTALAAFYNSVPVGHVEAGLRTWNYRAPYPEEMNRVLTTRLAALHFAPTAWARGNLRAEGVPETAVFVTGNPVIDALQMVVAKVREQRPPVPGLPEGVLNGPLVLITGHRRESFGKGFENICAAIAALSQRFRDTAFVYPVHLNPNVREPVFRLLGRQPNVHLIEPLSYLPFVFLMDRCRLLLTDSGGVQEEGPSLGKPVVVMRETTERPEGVEAGAVRLVGTDPQRIIDSICELLTHPEIYRTMAHAVNPYGDGKASDRIVRICEEFLDEVA